MFVARRRSDRLDEKDIQSRENTAQPVRERYHRCKIEQGSGGHQERTLPLKTVRSATHDRPRSSWFVKKKGKTFFLKRKICITGFVLFIYFCFNIVNYLHWNNYRNGLVRTKQGYRKFSALAEKMGFDYHDGKKSRYLLIIYYFRWNSFVTFTCPRSLYCAKENVLKRPVDWVLMNESKEYIAPIKQKVGYDFACLIRQLFTTKKC